MNITTNRSSILAKNILNKYETEKIIKEFNKNNIEVMLLKGTEFIFTLYKDLTLRETNDIDLFIKEKDVVIAEKILKKLGYNKIIEESYSHKMYAKDALVDLHWKLINYNSPIQKYVFKLNEKEIWKNAKEVNINGLKFKIMDNEDKLLYLCCHLVKERFAIKKWVFDIHKIISENKIDFSKIFKKGNRKVLSFTLYYTKKFFKTKITQKISNPNFIEEKIFDFIINHYNYYLMNFIYLLSIDNKLKIPFVILTKLIKQLFHRAFQYVKLIHHHLISLS